MAKYNVILADPPWKYTNDMVSGHRSTDHYQTAEPRSSIGSRFQMRTRRMMEIMYERNCLFRI